MRSQIVDRLFISGLLLLDIGISFYQPGTVKYRVQLLGGVPADVLLVALGVLIAVALADTVINDLLPERFVFGLAWRWRQRLWLLLAILLAGQAFVFAHQQAGYWIAASYAVLSARSAAVSFLDLHHEHESARRDRRCTDCGSALDA